MSALEIQEKFFHAVRDRTFPNRMNFLRYWLIHDKRGVVRVTLRDEDGSTCFHIAAAMGDRVMNLLLSVADQQGLLGLRKHWVHTIAGPQRATKLAVRQTRSEESCILDWRDAEGDAALLISTFNA